MKLVFYSVLVIPDLLMLSFFLDSKQVQGCVSTQLTFMLEELSLIL